MRRFYLFLGLLLFITGSIFPLQFVHITDTHIGSASGAKNLNSFCQLLNSFPEKPDFIIHTGDITEFGADEEFQTYSRIVSALNIPIYHTLGNHDVRWNGAILAIAPKLFPSYSRRGYTFNKEGITFIGLDSSFPFSQYGIIDPSQLNWLKETLSQLPKDQPIVVFCHHPLMLSNNFLFGQQALLEILKPYNVVLFLTGHGHSDRVWQVDGINFLMTKGLMDADASFRLIKIENEGIEVATYGLDGKEKSARLKFNLKRVGQSEISPNSKSANQGNLVAQLNGAIQGDLVASGNLIFACSWDGEVLALDGKSRTVVWKKRMDSPILSSPYVENGVLFVGFLNGYVRAFECKTGSMKWEVKLPEPVTGRLNGKNDRLFVPANRSIFALRTDNGSIIWRKDIGGSLESKPLIKDGILYIGAWDKNLYALRADNGEIIWKKETARSRYFSPATCLPIAWNNFILITQAYDSSSKKGGLLALDENGEIVWQVEGNFGYSTPIVAGDKLFIVSMEGKLLCVSPKGEVIWNISLGTSFFNSRPVIAGGKLYSVSFNGTLFILDISNGKLISKVRLSQDGCCVSTPVISEGSIFIGDMMGRIFAFPLSG
ncbi:PQQ-binding-like beta-propeller repeat protein [bacterium]|nr:PQQ-binding-like beta-propeller repeat protein [bacterium]